MNIALQDNRNAMIKEQQTLQSSFTDALKQKYCIDQDDQPTVGYVIMSPKRKSCAAQAELAHLNTVVLNGMDLNSAGIPQQGLGSLCPNIVDLDLANNQFCQWSELLAILSHLPKVRYVNVSRNSLKLDCANELPKSNLSVENLALNNTGVTIQDVVILSQIMPELKELHLCCNDYEILDAVDDGIREGHLSTLECLRLNNNNIKSWMEVWKLRYLPQLKQLILSGNPLSDIFYSKEDEPAQVHTESNSRHQTEICNEQKDHCVAEDEIFLHISPTDCDDLIHQDSNEIESEFQDLSFSTLGCDEDGDSDGRPYSRVARHDDSIVTDDDTAGCGSDREEENMNFNNNGHLQHKKSLYETAEDDSDTYYSLGFPSQEDFDAAIDAAVMESLLETEALLEAEVEEMHKAWAEAFLQEIIDNLVADQISEGLTDNLHDVVSPIIDDVMTEALDTVIPKEWIENTSSSGSCSEDDDDEVSDCPTLEASNCSLQFPASNIAESSASSTSMTSTDSTEQHFDTDYKLKWLNDKDTHFMSVEKSPSSSDFVHSSERCLFSSSEDYGKNSYDFQNSSNLNQNAILASDYQPGLQMISSIDNTQKSFPIQDSFVTISHRRVSIDLDSPTTRKTEFVTEVTSGEICDCDTEEKSDLDNVESVHVDQSASSEECRELSSESDSSILPFQYLETLCLSEAKISHWKHLQDLELFPTLTSVRMLENPLYSSVNPEDRRKLYISSLPKITLLNGSEVTVTEREKAERFYLRHFMDAEDKPDIFQTLVEKHGPPVRLVDIDLSQGYQEYVSMTFILKDAPDFVKDGKSRFTKKVHMQGLMGSLRAIIAKEMKIPKHCFIMFHSPCGPAHPEYERDIIELRCEGLPITRFDFSDGDEIHIELTGSPTKIFR